MGILPGSHEAGRPHESRVTTEGGDEQQQEEVLTLRVLLESSGSAFLKAILANALNTQAELSVTKLAQTGEAIPQANVQSSSEDVPAVVPEGMALFEITAARSLFPTLGQVVLFERQSA